MAFGSRRPRGSRLSRVLRLGGRIGKAAYVSTRLRFRGNGSRTQTTTRQRGGETAPLTYDNDFKTDYRYRRMPRRRRRRWVRFVRKVNAVTLKKQQGLKKVLFYGIKNLSTSTNQSGTTDMMMYTADGSALLDCADLGSIFRGHLGTAVFNDQNSFAAVGNGQKKLQFESCQMECTVRNLGTAAAIMEVYYVRCRKQHAQTNIDAGNTPTGIYQLGFLKQEQIEDLEEGTFIGTGPQGSTQIGTTPFQSPRFCETFKILRRKKYQIAPGNTISFLLKDPRNRTIEAGNVRSQLFMPFTTHGYLCQFYGVPGVDSVPVHALPANLIFSYTRKYQYYAPMTNRDQASTMPEV